MAPPPERPYFVAREVLDTVVAGYVTAGETLPDRQFVSIGPPAWDCELVAVWVERTAGHAGDISTEVVEPLAQAAGHGLRAALLRVQIVRCVPTIDDEFGEALPPSPAEEEAAAAVLLKDLQLVQNILLTASKAGELATCNDVGFIEWVSVGPDGGMAASTHGLRVSLAKA